MLVGLVSDTHGVFDPALFSVLAGVQHILHAGDVGNHGGHAAVLNALCQTGVPVMAVRGNVDDNATAMSALPATALVHLAGWTLLLVHILESVEAAVAMEKHQPDIVISGHSHKWSVTTVATTAGKQQLQINPGSAGPARFKLGRSAALLKLPERGSGDRPTVQRINLAAKAPPRLPEARCGSRPAVVRQGSHQQRRRVPAKAAATARGSRVGALQNSSHSKRQKM